MTDKQKVNARPGDILQISVIVPALNEAGNLRALVTRLDSTLAGRDYEVLIVDDGSVDGTPELCAALAREFPVRLLTRIHPSDGLSGAVLHGMREARGGLLVVMDADLQHPPEQVPELLAALVRDGAEFVIGSRYIDGSAMDVRWGLLRRVNSRIATFLARPFAGGTRDPMSGFFALRRSTFQRGKRFNPVGYKIALELTCKCRVTRVREVPIRFSVRTAGESKLNLRQQARYVDHLSRLYDHCFPRASGWAKFVIATAIAWFVAFGLYIRLVAHNASPVLAPTLAFAAAALASGAMHFRAVRRHGDPAHRKRDWIDFVVLTLGEWLACLLIARWVSAHVEPMSAVQFFAVVFGMVAVARFALRRMWVRNLRGMRAESSNEAEPGRATSSRQAA